MRKVRFLLAIAFILGLGAVAPNAEAGCFQVYVLAIEDCSNLGSYIERDACGIDAALNLAGCVRKTVLGV